jgi:hypothetical protein
MQIMQILLILSIFLLNRNPVQPSIDGIRCQFKHQTLHLTARMRLGQIGFIQRGGLTNRDLDTLSNWYSPSRQYVEIIRQEDSVQPRYGIALGFEFDETNGEYPYTPVHAKLQLKDFSWGGVEFSQADTLNYTGVSNEVSEDLLVEVLGFRNDTIFGQFSGLLLSGAGPMAQVDSGYFRVRVYRR